MYFSSVHSSDVLGALKLGQLFAWDHFPVVRQYAGCSSFAPLLSRDYFSLPTSFWRRSGPRGLPLQWTTWM